MKTLMGLALLPLVLLQATVFATEQRSQVVAKAELVRPLMNGEFVPDVTLQTEFGGNIRLRNIIASKPSVIIFYRGGWCPYCSRQMAELLEVEQRIIDLGYQIIAISPTSVSQLNKQSGADEFAAMRLSDSRLQAIRGFGLAYYVAEDMAARYRGKMGAELTTLQGSARMVLPVPAVYIVDESGLVQFHYANPNYKVRLPASLLYQAARIFRQGR